MVEIVLRFGEIWYKFGNSELKLMCAIENELSKENFVKKYTELKECIEMKKPFRWNWDECCKDSEIFVTSGKYHHTSYSSWNGGILDIPLDEITKVDIDVVDP